MMFQEHALAHLAGKEVEYDIEPPPFKHPDVKVNDKGHRVYSK